MLNLQEITKPQTNIVSISMGDIEIKKLTLGEVMAMGKKKDSDAMEFLLVNALVSPKITKDQVKNINADVSLEIQTAILDFNGLSEVDEKK